MPTSAEHRVLSVRASTPDPPEQVTADAELKVETPQTPLSSEMHAEPAGKQSAGNAVQKISPTETVNSSGEESFQEQRRPALQGSHHLERTGAALHSLECPICFDIYRAPVRTRCGHTFCFSCIMRHFRSRKSCPVCGSFLTRDQIAPDHTAQKAVRLARATSSSLLPKPKDSTERGRLYSPTHPVGGDQLKGPIHDEKHLAETECVAESDGEFKSEAAEAFAMLMAKQSGGTERLRQRQSRGAWAAVQPSSGLGLTLPTKMAPPEISNERRSSPASNQRFVDEVLGDLGKGALPSSGQTLSEDLKKLACRLSSAEIDQVVDALLEQRRRLQQVSDVTDYPTLKYFLDMFIEEKRLKIAKQQAQLERLEEDSRMAEEFYGRFPGTADNSSDADSPNTSATRRERMLALFEQLQTRYLELRASSIASPEQETMNAMKRPRRGDPDPAGSNARGLSPLALPPVTATDPARSSIGPITDDLEALKSFASEISSVTRYSSFQTLAALRYGEPFHGSNIVSCLDFDMFGEFLAAAGVMRKIKIFEFSAAINQNTQMQYPVCELPAHAKLSCLNWSPAARQHIAASDYDGVITIWDTNTCKPIAEYEEHEKRAWTVDYCPSKPHLLASGSDDGRVKLWSATQRDSVATIRMNANICSIKFAGQLYECCLAIGSADHSAYVYDLRSLTQPLHVLRGHNKAVSYVRFFPNGKELITASTDSTLRLWDLDHSRCARVFRGHCNERNFVGLTAKTDWTACGSEDNSLYAYFRSISSPILTYQFFTEQPQHLTDLVVSAEQQPVAAAASGARIRSSNLSAAEGPHFVSAVAWRKETDVLAAANSQGLIRILELR